MMKKTVIVSLLMKSTQSKLQKHELVKICKLSNLVQLFTEQLIFLVILAFN